MSCMKHVMCLRGHHGVSSLINPCCTWALLVLPSDRNALVGCNSAAQHPTVLGAQNLGYSS